MFLFCVWCACMCACVEVLMCMYVWCAYVNICVYALMCLCTWCACVCMRVYALICMCGMHVCVSMCVLTHTCGSQKRKPVVFFHHSQPYFLKTGSPTEQDIQLGWMVRELPWSTSLPPNSGVRGMCSHAWLFMRFLGIQTQILLPLTVLSLYALIPDSLFLATYYSSSPAFSKNTFTEIKFPSQTIHPILSWYLVGFVLIYFILFVQPK